MNIKRWVGNADTHIRINGGADIRLQLYLKEKIKITEGNQ